MKKISLFSKNDLLVLIVISAVSILLLIPHFLEKDALTAEISVNSETVKTVNLNEVTEPYEIKLDCSPSVTVKVEAGKICISHAECRNRLCVGCGWLDSNGDMAVCLPAKVTVAVKGEKAKNSPDVITY